MSFAVNEHHSKNTVSFNYSHFLVALGILSRSLSLLSWLKACEELHIAIRIFCILYCVYEICWGRGHVGLVVSTYASHLEGVRKAYMLSLCSRGFLWIIFHFLFHCGCIHSPLFSSFTVYFKRNELMHTVKLSSSFLSPPCLHSKAMEQRRHVWELV